MKQLNQEGTIKSIFCLTKAMLANFFTKPLLKIGFPSHRENLNLCDKVTSEIKEFKDIH